MLYRMSRQYCNAVFSQTPMFEPESLSRTFEEHLARIEDVTHWYQLRDDAEDVLESGQWIVEYTVEPIDFYTCCAVTLGLPSFTDMFGDYDPRFTPRIRNVLRTWITCREMEK